ncbi:MAG TPA: ATP-grasp fold amidoligase family protein, partial [bacterium]|nr:ATP-grasp fold amidoligase family protein [bacterium]
GSVPTDYKLFVFDGRVELIAIHVDRFEHHRSNVYGRLWNKLEVLFSFPNTERDVDPPKHLHEMIAYAEALGRGLDFVRVDLYDTDEKVYFGEITTTPGGAMDIFDPVEFDRQLGELWHLSSGCGLRTGRRRGTDAIAGGVWRDGRARR